MRATSRKSEWMMVFAGVITAAPIQSMVMFLFSLFVGDEQSQTRGEAISYWLFGISVAVGALMGALVSAFTLSRSKRVMVDWPMLVGSWLVATLIACPVSLVWTAISTFSMPGGAAAAAMSAAWVLIAVVVSVVCSRALNQ